MSRISTSLLKRAAASGRALLAAASRPARRGARRRRAGHPAAQAGRRHCLGEAGRDVGGASRWLSVHPRSCRCHHDDRSHIVQLQSDSNVTDWREWSQVASSNWAWRCSWPTDRWRARPRRPWSGRRHRPHARRRRRSWHGSVGRDPAGGPRGAARVTNQTAGHRWTRWKAGYVETVADPADGRARLVRLTDRAQALVPVANAEVERVLDEWTAPGRTSDAPVGGGPADAAGGRRPWR